MNVTKLKGTLSEFPQASSGTCRAVEIATGKTKRIRFEIDPHASDDRGLMVEVSYTLDKDPLRGAEPLARTASRFLEQDSLAREVRLPIKLVCTRPHFGGVRWWFSCPLQTGSGGVCARRVQKLWLPPGQMYYGCSVCYGLTHKSSLECHDFDGLCRLVTAGVSEEETARLGKAAFKSLVSYKKVEKRKRRERTKSLVELFDGFCGEGPGPRRPKRDRL